MWKSIFVDKFILCVPQPIFMVMEITVDTLSYTMDQMDDLTVAGKPEVGRIRMVISLKDQVELGTLYFEKAKKTFQRKPIGMDGWACVDAKIEGLYVHGGEHITPKDIVRKCQDLIKGAGL
jgi:hypothetical protein